MLKTKMDHFFGSQEKYDLQLVKLTLDTTDLDENEALENGWLIANNEWYQSRSVRINIDEYFKKLKKKPLPEDYSIWHKDNMNEEDIEAVKKVYKEFCDKKGFDIQYDLFSDSDRSAWLIIYKGLEAVAFTKFIRYTDAYESQFTAWNYSEPKLSLAKRMVEFEAGLSNALFPNTKYLYIGQGYEKGSAYKADFAGFEWWTGNEWSTDREVYKSLCARDSSINTLDDLTKAYNYA
jgi:hypothetical protein